MADLGIETSFPVKKKVEGGLAKLKAALKGEVEWSSLMKLADEKVVPRNIPADVLELAGKVGSSSPKVLQLTGEVASNTPIRDLLAKLGGMAGKTAGKVADIAGPIGLAEMVADEGINLYKKNLDNFDDTHAPSWAHRDATGEAYMLDKGEMVKGMENIKKLVREKLKGYDPSTMPLSVEMMGRNDGSDFRGK